MQKAQKFGMGFFGGLFLVQGFFGALFETLGIWVFFLFLPPFDNPRHLKSRVLRLGLFVFFLSQ